ncbi:MAG: hypothetical protein J6Y92_10640 [Lentisphaeria bacterium]|nr:hypothetical protein [Lentisphaeria bacterium]
MKHTNHRLAAVLLGIVMLFSASASVHAQSQWMDKVTLYFPNRILDLLDVFSLNIGVGLTAHASLRATHEAEIGGGFSATAQMIKDQNRQYGFARRDGYYSGIGPIVATDMQRRPAYLLVKEYYWDKDGLVTPSEEHFLPKEGVVDFWEIGGSLGLGVIEADVSIHPIEILDAVLGFFFIDITDDDLTFENFR